MVELSRLEVDDSVAGSTPGTLVLVVVVTETLDERVERELDECQ